MSTANNVLQVAGMSLDLGGRAILRNISLDLGRGEFLGIIGPNGGGKTSFLRLLVGLLQPTAGKLQWTSVASPTPRIGYVPQKTMIEAHYPLSSIEVVRQGGEGGWPVFGARRKRLFQRSEELLSRVGLSEQPQTRVVDLSGGQQRRLLLARALMNDPEILLLDEPTAGVDTRGQEQFCEIVHEISRQGVTVVLVSHDIPLITKYADRIACISRGVHWHGAACDLDDKIVHAAYSCELERYQTRREIAPPHVHDPGHDHGHGHHHH